MKIDLGGGAYLEPDEGPRDSRFHKRILKYVPIPNARVGHYADLECGHRVMLFGPLELVGEVAFCTACRDREVSAPAE